MPRSTKLPAPLKGRLPALLAVLLVFAAFAALSLLPHPLDREIRELPDGERRALYLRTFETLRTTCDDAVAPNLTDYCRDQASFLERFPEYDGRCRSLVGSFGATPSR